jgi:hypothetical protein
MCNTCKSEEHPSRFCHSCSKEAICRNCSSITPPLCTSCYKNPPSSDENIARILSIAKDHAVYMDCCDYCGWYFHEKYVNYDDDGYVQCQKCFESGNNIPLNREHD